MNDFWVKEKYVISTDKGYLDQEMIFEFLEKESYWSSGIKKEIVIKSIKNSTLCFGLYNANPQVGPAAQIGFAKVISDLATFAYLADVFILKKYRGQGLAKWMMQVIIDHPELQGIRRFMLATGDAHDLYKKYGFKHLDSPDLFMQIVKSYR